MASIENVALVDMDGTLCEFRPKLDADLARILGPERSKVSPKTIEQVEYAIRSRKGWYASLKPIALGFRIVRMLEEIGFRIVIMTKSSKEAKNAWSEKVEWISEWLPHVDMIVTQDKGLVYGKLLVDDYPGHFFRWLEHRPRGVVIMPQQPWNKEVSGTKNIHPVMNDEDLATIRPLIEKVYKRGS
jgi:5'-nucleotidase